MKTYSSLVAFIGIIALLILPMHQNHYQVKQGYNQDYLDIVSKSFQVLDADFDALNIQGWAQINKKSLTAHKDLNEVYSQITNTLQVSNNPTITNSDKDFMSYYQKEAINSCTYLEIFLQKCQKNEKGYEVYLGVQLVSHDLADSKSYYQRVSQVYRELDADTDIGVTIVCTQPGKMSKTQQLNYLAKGFSAVNAKVVEGINAQQLLSYSGYTDICQDFINVDAKKLNINIAMRYHQLDDMTYINIGAPLIYQEY